MQKGFFTLLIAYFLPVFLLTTPVRSQEEGEGSKWIQLFNGKDLTGWTPKIRYQEFGKDPRKTFRVEEGVIKVGYENYEEFGETFGHLFYKTPFSKYRLRVEYRFLGDQLKGGPGWAFRNSGLMLHGQDPKEMTADQDFPNSIEVQLLGGNGEKDRTTMNLCTPGTDVVMNGKLLKKHCISSKSKTYHGDQWVTAEVIVDGSNGLKHIVEGEVVLEYKKPQLDDGTLLEAGTISLQSESHPCEFRKVELLPLDDDSAASEPQSSEGWVELFDGKTLDGWHIKSGTATYKIDDGCIVGTTIKGSPNTFLCSDQTFSDFELKFETKFDQFFNSGCQIRSKLKGDKFGGRVYGPQVEIEKSPGQSGFIYGEAAGGWQSPEPKSKDAKISTHSHFKNDGWNQYRVLAVGRRIQTWINGEQVADLEYDEERYKENSEGFIGLQVHGVGNKEEPMSVRWRNISIRKIESK